MFKFVIITSLLCTGVFITTWEGMILYPLTKVYDCTRSKYKFLCRLMGFLRNPLFGCMYCMASFWTLVSWILQGFPFEWYMLPFYMLCVCGMNAISFAIIRFTVPEYDGK